MSNAHIVTGIVIVLLLYNLVELVQMARRRSKALRQKKCVRNTQGDFVTPSYVPCPDCSTTCEFCQGAGRVRCEMLRCGGEGFLTLASQPCSAPGCRGATGRILAGCTLCAETGIEVLQRGECPSCEGTGKQVCGKCRGTGRMSTGRLDGALAARGGDPEPPDCPACRGQGRVSSDPAGQGTPRAQCLPCG